jgi:hypothetical protein
MLRQPIFNDSHFADKIVSDLESFLLAIFEQSPNDAYRRSRVFWGKKFDDHLCQVSQSLWLTKQEQERARRNEKSARRANTIHFVKTIPNRLLKMLMGKERYEAIKENIRKVKP